MKRGLEQAQQPAFKDARTNCEGASLPLEWKPFLFNRFAHSAGPGREEQAVM